MMWWFKPQLWSEVCRLRGPILSWPRWNPPGVVFGFWPSFFIFLMAATCLPLSVFSPSNWRRLITNLVPDRQMSWWHIPHPQFSACVWKMCPVCMTERHIGTGWGWKIFSFSQYIAIIFFSLWAAAGKHENNICSWTVLVWWLWANDSGNKIIRSTVAVTASLALMFRLVQLTPNASDTRGQSGVKQPSLPWEATAANSAERRGEGG